MTDNLKMPPAIAAHSDGSVDRRLQEMVGFPLHVIGRSFARIIPRQIGNWWLEPLTSNTYLPVRAQRRLDRLLAAGVKPKAVVVFHEIAEHRAKQSYVHDIATRIIFWAKHDLPSLSQESLQVSLRSPLAAIRSLIEKRNPPPPKDPCLVIVTEDGYWIEVDRWLN